jgi:hypothetical protein
MRQGAIAINKEQLFRKRVYLRITTAHNVARIYYTGILAWATVEPYKPFLRAMLKASSSMSDFVYDPYGNRYKSAQSLGAAKWTELFY